MNDTQDTDGAATSGDDARELNPQEAAELLDQTRRQAQRQFNPRPPLVTFMLSLLALIGYGSLWLSVLGQHPYKGPRGWAIGLVYAMVVLVIVVALAATHRAGEGIGRKRSLEARLAAIVVATAWICVYVYEGALYHAGISVAIVSGIYPATAPLLILGLVGAAISAVRGEWLFFGGALFVACVAAIAAFTGPIAVWLVMGIGLSAALMAGTVVQIRQQHA